MSVFSELLSSLIKQSGFTIPQISRRSGISDASLCKFRSGLRLPKNEDQLKALFPALCLTVSQTDRLLEEYRIEKLGRERYRCFMKVKDILENPAFSYSGAADFVSASHSSYTALSTLSNIKTVYKGESQLNSLIMFLIDQECRNEIPTFSIILSTEYLFLNKYLSSCSLSHRGKEPLIFHILNLLPASDVNSGYDNIRQLENMIPMIGSCRNYEPRYLYNADNTGHPYPYFLLTSDYLLVLSADLKTGILQRDSDILAEYQSTFHEIWDMSTPLIKKFADELEYLDYFIPSGHQISHTASHMLSPQPCLPPFISPETGRKHLVPEMVGNPEIQHFLQRYFLSLPPKSCSIFTLDGLSDFLANGRLLELPDGSYIPFSHDEAKEIVQGFLSALQCEKEDGLLLKPGMLALSTNLVCYVYTNGDFSLMWQPPARTATYFLLQEKTTASLFTEFIQYIIANRVYTYSRDETLALLETLLES